MKISSAIFDRSAPDLESCPDESLPEFALIGRSNVGKSSLLNMLSGKKDLARTSGKPGSTTLINFFTMNGSWRFVDLPGYGFARQAKEQRSKFIEAVADYLQFRSNLCCVFALIDSRIPPQAIDLEFVEWLCSNEVPYALVYTKAEKAKPTKLQATMDAFTEHAAQWSDQQPGMFTTSATKGLGRKELLRMINEVLSGDET